MNTDLSEKTVLITGGALRVGAALVRTFQKAGAHVLIHGGKSLEAAQ